MQVPTLVQLMLLANVFNIPIKEFYDVIEARAPVELTYTDHLTRMINLTKDFNPKQWKLLFGFIGVLNE